PLLIWTWKKNQSYKIDKQGHDVLNFQITMMLLLFLGGFLLMLVPITLAVLEEIGISTKEGGPIFMLLVMCAPMPMLLVGLFCTYQGVVNAMRALSEKSVRYPLSIPFVK
ncbi:MAG: DUF4870 domain-containing protein, partial [Anaerolineales bacterium]